MLQFVDNEHVGDCPTSDHLRRILQEFHHNLNVHCGMSQDCIDGGNQHVEEMSNKQILKKIWKLLWNKDKKGLDLADSESTHVTTHVPHIILSVQVVSLIYNSLSSEQWYNGPKNKFLIPN